MLMAAVVVDVNFGARLHDDDAWAELACFGDASIALEAELLGFAADGDEARGLGDDRDAAGAPVCRVTLSDITVIKQAEENLQESETRFRSMFDDAPTGYHELDAEGRIVRVNRTELALLGYSAEEMLGRPVWEFVEERAVSQEAVLEKLAGMVSTAQSIERTFCRKGGAKISVLIQDRLLRGKDGRITGIRTTVQDITARKQAEKTMELSKQRLELAHRSAGAGTWDWDMIDQHLEWSRELYSLFGLDPGGAGATFETWKQVIHPADRANAADRIARAVREKLPLTNEYRVVHPDGRVRWISALGNTTYDQSGQPVRMTGICIDITERKQTAAALEELKVRVGAQEIFHVLVESASDGFWLLDKQFMTVYVNHSVEQILGYTRQEMVGRSWYDFGDPEWVARAKELEKRRTTGVKEPHQFLFIHKDGRKVLTRIATTPLYDKDGNFDGALGVLSDLTRQKEAEDALELKHMLNAIAQSAGIGMSILNPDYTITWYNSLFEGWFGPLGKIRGRNCFEVFERRNAICSKCPAQITFQTGEVVTAERSGIGTPAGAGRILALTTSPIRDATGKVIQVVEITQDITERRRTEDALRESEAKYRALIESTGTGYLILDGKGRVADANSEYVRLSGHRELREILGRSVVEWTAEYEKTKNAEAVARCVTEGSIRNLVLDYVDHTGRITPVEVSATVEGKGGEARILSVCRDISERRRAELALRESEARLRAITDNAGAVIYMKDMAGRYIYVNHVFEELFHIKVAAIQGKTDYEIFPRDIAEGFIRNDRLVILTEQAREMEEKVECDGNVRTYLSSKFPLRTSGGKLYAVCGVSTDITERKRAEAQLRESEASLKESQHIARLGSFVFDLINGTWRSSEVLDQLLGIDHAYEHSMAGWLAVVHPDDRTMVAGYFTNEVIGRDQAFDKEYRVIRVADQAERWLWSRASLERDNQGRALRLRGTSQDVTARKEAEAEKVKLEAQFQQAQKMESVGRLAGGVAHDFNNMLQAILGNVDLALEGVPLGSPTDEGLREIRKCAERSADLTRQLLAFARRQTIAPKVLDLNATLESLLKMLRRLIGEDIDLAWLPARDLGLVKVDPTQVDQILANLCVNARDAIGGVGKVTIETANAAFDAAYCVDHPRYMSGEYVRLTVSDNGCGMNQATLAQIFEPFFTTKGSGSGTGLGLPTVYGIVKQNHGFITVYSELGHGTTFTVYLPRHAGQATATGTAIVAEMPKSTGETVLLVEDEPAVRGIARMILERLGYKVLAASTPGEAIRLAETPVGEIHLLITDVVMPGMNGRDLNARLLALRPKLKCLFMSGYTADVIGHHGVLEAGVNFIQKPFSIGDLAAKVRTSLGDSSPQPGDFK